MRMLSSFRQTSPVRIALCLAPVFFLLAAGCGSEDPPPVVKQEPAPPSLPELAVPSSFTTPENEEFLFQPLYRSPDKKSTVTSSPMPLQFSAEAPLPAGATLDPESGEIRWTPSEQQGPGSSHFELRYQSVEQASLSGTVAFDVHVTEQNAPPSLSAPQEVRGRAGALLEFSLKISDDDFPSNRLDVAVRGPISSGIHVDTVAGKCYWDVPADWKKERTAITLVVSDNGKPALTAEQPVQLLIEPVSKPVTVEREPAPAKRRPDLYVGLPDLPTKVSEVEPITVPLKGFNPGDTSATAALTLSLVMPSDLNTRLNVFYPPDLKGAIQIRSTVPFEAESGTPQQTLPDLVIADCRLKESSLVWTWAMTKDRDVRGLQNNIRQCVLSIDEPSGKSLWLTALQPINDVAAPAVASFLDDRDFRQRLFSRPGTAVLTAFDETEFKLAADSGSGHLCQVVSNGNALEVTASGLKNAPGINHLKFDILSLSREMVIKFGSEPSIDQASEAASSAANILNGMRSNARQASTKLAKANAAYESASRIRVRNQSDQIQKDAQLRRANSERIKWAARLRELEVKFPVQERVAATAAQELEALASRFKPLKDLHLTGELRRTVSDIEVVVARLLMPRELSAVEN